MYINSCLSLFNTVASTILFTNTYSKTNLIQIHIHKALIVTLYRVSSIYASGGWERARDKENISFKWVYYKAERASTFQCFLIRSVRFWLSCNSHIKYILKEHQLFYSDIIKGYMWIFFLFCFHNFMFFFFCSI